MKEIKTTLENCKETLELLYNSATESQRELIVIQIVQIDYQIKKCEKLIGAEAILDAPSTC